MRMPAAQMQMEACKSQPQHAVPHRLSASRAVHARCLAAAAERVRKQTALLCHAPRQHPRGVRPPIVPLACLERRRRTMRGLGQQQDRQQQLARHSHLATNRRFVDQMAEPSKRSVFKRAAPAPKAGGGGSPASGDGLLSAPALAPAPLRARGVRPSVFSKSTLTSSGLAELDSALGGGVALGTVVCVVEDSPSECHALLLKHFLAQGLVHGHVSALCSADDTLIRTLPVAIPPGSEEGGAGDKSRPPGAGMVLRTSASSHGRGGLDMPKDEHLKIAWRYKESLSVAERHAATPSSSAAADYCLRFDLSKTQDASEGTAVQAADGSTGARAAVRHVTLCDWEEKAAEPGGLRKAWQEVTSLIDANATRPVVSTPEAGVPSGAREHTVCRIALASLGAPIWWPPGARAEREGGARGGRRGDAAERSAGLRETMCFLHALKGKVRGTDSVVFATIPPDIAATQEGQQLLRTSDYIIRLDSVHSCPQAVRNQYSEYAAFLHLQKVLRVGTLVSFTPDSLHFLLKLRKRALHLERMHSSVPEEGPAPPATEF